VNVSLVELPAGRENDTPITAADAARRAGVTPQAIANWVRRGKLEPAGTDRRGRRVYWWIDVCKAEAATRRGARRNVGLKVVATQDISDNDAVLVRLDCGHLKILSADHAPTPGRSVACFECATRSDIHHVVLAGAGRRIAA
jgi:hypothetical protein